MNTHARTNTPVAVCTHANDVLKGRVLKLDKHVAIDLLLAKSLCILGQAITQHRHPRSDLLHRPVPRWHLGGELGLHGFVMGRVGEL